MRDSIDFGSMSISRLFRKMLLPTLFSMVVAAVLTITDGAFVGRGLGSEALAAVNIVVPIWLFATGVGLMFGMGASVVASVHLSHENIKAARLNMTQALSVSTLFLALCSTLIVCNSDLTLRLLGCSEQLMQPARDYLLGFVPFMAVNALLCSAGFFLRLDGSPNYSMFCNVLSAVLNIILDYLFIFEFGWGVFGAAIATSIGSIVGVVLMIIYLFDRKHILHFVRIKLSLTSLKLTIRNVGYMCRLGVSSFLCDAAVSSMMLCGNYVFMSYLGEPGVAAFSVACYFFPIVFMLYTGIGQSAQPIISYNSGINEKSRVREAFLLALKTALWFGFSLLVITWLCSSHIVQLFISDKDPAFVLATHGLPLFALGFVPFAVSIVSIGYFQSVERIKSAAIVTVMRGFVLITLSFFSLPLLLGVDGIWLAVPLAELLTALLVVLIYMKNREIVAAIAVK